MAYHALYRKYRPTKFSDVYGQEIVKKILKNSIENNKIAHAYLFYGPRGTGKTSIAKLFARVVNCENSIDSEPCEKCNSCIESKDKECVDIIEIDAASNNGVDEIRELKNKINLVPNSLKYKVYIIDEVHMLSTGAFNALLKTLEEPPEHIIFILATTEIYEVPSTIISRCQLLEFKNIDDNNLKLRLKDVCSKENIKIADDAIEEIVKNSSGGLRDALSLLDKLYAYCDNDITSNDVRTVLGIASDSEIQNFIDLFLNNDTDQLLNCINNFFSSGQDIIKILDEIILKLRNMIFKNNKYELIEYINNFIKLESSLSKSNNKKIIFEMFIIDKTNVRTSEPKIIENEKIIVKEKNIDNIKKVEINDKFEVNNEQSNKLIEIRINNTFATANKQLLNNIKNNWKELEKFVFDSTIGAYVCDLVDSIPIVCGDSHLMIMTKYDSIADKMNININKYENIISTKLNVDVKLVALSPELWKKKKDEFVINTKNNVKYNYIDEENQINDNNINIDKKINNIDNKKNIKEKAKELFGDLV